MSAEQPHAAGAARAGEQTASAVKKGAGMLHGAGEAIRGNINTFVDSAAGDKAGVAKNADVAERGVNEVDRSRMQHTGATTGTTTSTTDDLLRHGDQSHTAGTKVVPGSTGHTGHTGLGGHDHTLR